MNQEFLSEMKTCSENGNLINPKILEIQFN